MSWYFCAYTLWEMYMKTGYSPYSHIIFVKKLKLFQKFHYELSRLLYWIWFVKTSWISVSIFNTLNLKTKIKNWTGLQLARFLTNNSMKCEKTIILWIPYVQNDNNSNIKSIPVRITMQCLDIVRIWRRRLVETWVEIINILSHLLK